MLKHEVLVVLDGETVLLVRVGCVLLELELKLIDEHLGLLLVCLWGSRRLVPLLDNALQKFLRLELDHRLNPKQRLADISRFIVRTVREHVPIRDSIAEKVVIGPLSKVADVDSGAEM